VLTDSAGASRHPPTGGLQREQRRRRTRRGLALGRERERLAGAPLETEEPDRNRLRPVVAADKDEPPASLLSIRG